MCKTCPHGKVKHTPVRARFCGGGNDDVVFVGVVAFFVTSQKVLISFETRSSACHISAYHLCLPPLAARRRSTNRVCGAMSSPCTQRVLVALAARRAQRGGFRGGVAELRAHQSSPARVPKTKTCTTTAFARPSNSAVDRLDLTGLSEEDVRALVPQAWREDTTNASSHGMASRGEGWKDSRGGPIELAKKNEHPGAESFHKSSRSCLTQRDAWRFQGDGLFAQVARAVCTADVLPRKELFETWEAALIITEVFGDRLDSRDEKNADGDEKEEKEEEGKHTRVLDLAGGHGFLALCVLVLNPHCTSALVVDRRKPDSYGKLLTELTKAFPKIHGRARFEQASLAGVCFERDENETALLVSVHACGTLSDLILQIASESKISVALVPCCHRGLGSARLLAKRLSVGSVHTNNGDLHESEKSKMNADTKASAQSEISAPTAVDVARVTLLRRAGFHVVTKTLPREITPENRVILGAFGEINEVDNTDNNQKKSGERAVSPGWVSVNAGVPESPWRWF